MLPVITVQKSGSISELMTPVTLRLRLEALVLSAVLTLPGALALAPLNFSAFGPEVRLGRRSQDNQKK
jgi:hypothetical protein